MMTLDYLKTLPLDIVQHHHRSGNCTEETYKAYCHLWQTSAPRFSVQACWCVECQATGPFADKEQYALDQVAQCQFPTSKRVATDMISRVKGA